MGFNEIMGQTAIHQEIPSRMLKRLQFRVYIKKPIKILKILLLQSISILF